MYLLCGCISIKHIPMDTISLLKDLYIINKLYKKRNKKQSLYFNVVPLDLLPKKLDSIKTKTKSLIIYNTDKSPNPGE